MRTQRAANYLILAAAIMIHVWLCYLPSVQRGYPPMNPYMEYIAPLLSIFVLFLALPLNRYLTRPEIWGKNIFFALIYSIGLGSALQFRLMGHAIPNHGPYLLDTLTITAIVLIPTIIIITVADCVVDMLMQKQKLNHATTSHMSSTPSNM